MFHNQCNTRHVTFLQTAMQMFVIPFLIPTIGDFRNPLGNSQLTTLHRYGLKSFAIHSLQ